MVSPREKSIRFLGERKDVEALVQLMDIGVLCTFTEGISNAVMEYMAAGKPVIVTDGGGSCELVADDETGFLVAPFNPESVAEKIEALLNEPVRASGMVAAGFRRLQMAFSLEQLLKYHLRLYRKVLNRTYRVRA